MGEDVEVTVATGGTPMPATVAAVDSLRNLAVLQLPEWIDDTAPVATEISDGAYAWSIYYEGCGSLATDRTRLSGWTGPRVEPVGPLSSLSPDAAGAPLVDRTGAWIGVVSETERMMPRAVALDLVEDARQRITVQVGTGGFPWKWVGGGVAVVGTAPAVLLSGGGDPGPTTGDLLITFPGGSP